MSLPQVWCLAALAFGLDQLSKWAVLVLLDLPSLGKLVILPGLFNFVMVWNRGINFGLFSTDGTLGRIVLVMIPLGACLALSWWLRRGAPRRRALGVALIIGGALGNAADRVVHGAVVDFLNVSAFGLHNPFAFNLADAWVFLGAALLLLPEPSAAAPAPPEDDHD